MDSHEWKAMLEGVRQGRISIDDALQRIDTAPFADTGGFAKMDLHRRFRCGFPEVVFGQGKTAEQIEAILNVLVEHEHGGLVTRVDRATADHLKTSFPHAQYNPLGRTFQIKNPADPEPKLGRVVVVTAGTSDL